jgi:hypothetical protein
LENSGEVLPKFSLEPYEGTGTYYSGHISSNGIRTYLCLCTN